MLALSARARGRCDRSCNVRGSRAFVEFDRSRQATSNHQRQVLPTRSLPVTANRL
jgi:hypothetical protein